MTKNAFALSSVVISSLINKDRVLFGLEKKMEKIIIEPYST